MVSREVLEGTISELEENANKIEFNIKKLLENTPINSCFANECSNDLLTFRTFQFIP